MSASLWVKIRYVFAYRNEKGQIRNVHSIRGVCRKRAAELVRAQYEVKHYRCYCGRKDLFCEFNPLADKHECMGKRNKRTSRIAKYLQRKIDRAKKEHGKQSKPAIEFRYEFDAPRKATRSSTCSDD